MTSRMSSAVPLLLLSVLSAVAVANIYYAQPLLAQMGVDIHLDEAQLGWIVGAGQAGYLLGLIFIVPLGDRLNRQKMIPLLVLGAALGVGLVALAHSALQLFLGIALAGLFSVLVQVVVGYTAALSVTAERGRNIGLVTSGVVIGIILARTVSGSVAELLGWRAVYIGSVAALLLLLVLAVRKLPQDELPASKITYRAAILSVVTLTRRNHLFRLRALISMFLFASFGTLWSGMALPLSAKPWELSTSLIGLFGIAGLFGALGASRAGRWADRGWGERVTAMSLLLLIASWLMIAQVGYSLWLFALGVVVLDFAVQAVHVSSQSRLVATAPAASSRIIGSYMVFYSVGSAVGAVSSTMVYQSLGWGAVSLLGAAFAAAALVVWATGTLPRGDTRANMTPLVG